MAACPGYGDSTKNMEEVVQPDACADGLVWPVVATVTLGGGGYHQDVPADAFLNSTQFPDIGGNSVNLNLSLSSGGSGRSRWGCYSYSGAIALMVVLYTVLITI